MKPIFLFLILSLLLVSCVGATKPLPPLELRCCMQFAEDGSNVSTWFMSDETTWSFCCDQTTHPDACYQCIEDAEQNQQTRKLKLMGLFLILPLLVFLATLFTTIKGIRWSLRIYKKDNDKKKLALRIIGNVVFFLVFTFIALAWFVFGAG